MPIRLDYPVFLLALPIVVVALVVTRDRVLSLWGWRRDLSGGLRLLAATGFAMALAQPAIRVPDDAASVVIAVDESASMAPAALRDAQAWIDRALRTRRAADRVGLVAFGGGHVHFRSHVHAGGSVHAQLGQHVRGRDGVAATRCPGFGQSRLYQSSIAPGKIPGRFHSGGLAGECETDAELRPEV